MAKDKATITIDQLVTEPFDVTLTKLTDPHKYLTESLVVVVTTVFGYGHVFYSIDAGLRLFDFINVVANGKDNTYLTAALDVDTIRVCQVKGIDSSNPKSITVDLRSLYDKLPMSDFKITTSKHQEMHFDILPKLTEQLRMLSVTLPVDWPDRKYIPKETKPINEVINEGISFNEIYIREEIESVYGLSLNKEEFGKLIEELKFIHSKMT